MAKLIEEKGGELYKNHRVIALKARENKIIEIKIKNEKTGEILIQEGEYFFSSMPVKELVQRLEYDVPCNVLDVSNGLIYRDFMTVGLLLKKLKIKNSTKIKTINNLVPDNWIYIQERDVKIGRLQIFNNWSPYMVANPETVWIGLEYFCNEGDELWNIDNQVGS